MSLFQANLVVNKNINAKGKIPDIYFHNIVRLFQVLRNLPFTAIESMGDYYFTNIVYKSLFTTSQTTLELGSQEYRKYQKIVPTSQTDSLVPSIYGKMKVDVILAENC